MGTVRTWIAAHRKALLAAIAAVAILFVPEATVDMIIAFVGAGLTFFVPNDPAAVEQIYGARRAR